MTRLFEYVVAQNDPYQFVYECLSGDHGDEAQTTMSNLYASISVDEGFHPDDDFEQIIERMLDQIEQDVV
jgi:hypothetical protein